MDTKNSQVFLFLLITALESLATENSSYCGNIEEETNTIFNGQNKILSRRKRFLTFPDGSSFQLVFCTQTHGYLQIGDVVWFGNTAALAWELPTDPALFHMFKNFEKGDPGLRRQDTQQVVYLNENGKVLAAVPYPRKKIIVNPAFAKRSVNEPNEASNEAKLSIKQLHETSRRKSYQQEFGNSVEFQRETRMSLYVKLEKFFGALGFKGKQCVLRLHCENGKASEEQGTFMDEIYKAIFTLPVTSNHEKHPELLHEYDTAHTSKEDCAKLYPECGNLNGIPLFGRHS